ncbi:MAG: response regulator [Polyangia bacterium]
MVVDDQIELAENIAEILQGVGFQTEVATSAEEALTRVAQGGISGVVSDYKLPGATGAELTKELRRRGERLPVLIMSAYTDDTTIEGARASGAWLFLPKPVPLPTLIQAFDSLAQQPVSALVVDDEPGLAENLAEALTAAGHEVVLAHSVADALAHNRRIHSAIVDMRLPDGSGLDVALQLRARDPEIQILFISGYTDDLETERHVTGSQMLEKPLDPRRVVSWVERVVDPATRS